MSARTSGSCGGVRSVALHSWVVWTAWHCTGVWRAKCGIAQVGGVDGVALHGVWRAKCGIAQVGGVEGACLEAVDAARLKEAAVRRRPPGLPSPGQTKATLARSGAHRSLRAKSVARRGKVVQDATLATPSQPALCGPYISGRPE
eukprot:365662-Chlamydomonas_euryale.AAC.11